MADQTQGLNQAAEYGRLAFDVFLMERWDYAADVKEDKNQWDDLARQWLAMTPVERTPYHLEAGRRFSSNYDTAASDNIVVTRVLPALQTVQERNFCSVKTTHNSQDPALVRTYYGDVDGQNQDDAHKNMLSNFLSEGLIDKNGAWNNKALYDFGDDWQRVLLRVPQLCDEMSNAWDDDDESDDSVGLQNQEAPPATDRDALEPWLWSMSRKVATRFYVVDREAMETGKIKIFYLDTHGRAIWHHKLAKDMLLEFNGAWHSMSLAEINFCSEAGENGCEIFL